jgi:membrane protease subunit HflK
MNVKEKASLITIAVAVTFTALKFVIYLFSGSIAVLSEAWHSFSDIFTSLLVFYSFRKDRLDALQCEKAGAAVSEKAGEEALSEKAGSKEDSEKAGGEAGVEKAGVEEGTEKAGVEESRGKTASAFRVRMSTELKAAIIIACALVVIAIGIFYKVLTSQQTTIERPIISGVFFICFSIGSYFLYRFSTSVGTSEGSAALISDGLHSRADMNNSLLTGFSLILYALGINVDRIVGGILAFFILSYALVMFANIEAMVRRGEARYVARYNLYSLISSAFSAASLGNLVGMIDSGMGVRFRESEFFKRIDRWKWKVFALAAIGLYGLTSIYIVAVDEAAIVERFGKPIGADHPVPPGLHLKCPWPIDRVVRVKTRRIRDLRLGNISYESGFALIWTRQHGEEERFLSGDNSFFNPYLILHYRVADPALFIYNQRDPEQLLENSAYRELNGIFVTQEFEKLAVGFRKALERDFKSRLQQEIDRLGIGIEIVNVIIKDVHPPLFISRSYEDVIAAFQEKQRYMNDAVNYRNRKIPVARADAERAVQESHAYVTDRVLRAEGDAERFKMQIEAFSVAPAITRKRMYLDLVGRAVGRSTRVLVDPKTGIPDVWFNAPGVPGMTRNTVKREEGP